MAIGNVGDDKTYISCNVWDGIYDSISGRFLIFSGRYEGNKQYKKLR
jgi:hypothetical protein